jgi:hypothetical protein
MTLIKMTKRQIDESENKGLMTKNDKMSNEKIESKGLMTYFVIMSKSQCQDEKHLS